MRYIFLLLLLVVPARAQNFPAPQGEWAYQLNHPDPERGREWAESMRKFHDLQAESVECKRMNIGCPEYVPREVPVINKSLAQIQRELDEAQAYYLRLHPSLGRKH